MHVLVLGGTVFVGRHIVEAALAAGHRVTLFNRGRQQAGLFPEAEKLRGDRDADLTALHGRRFDAVIDTCGYRPEQLAATAAALGDGAPFYLFVSSISAYRSFPPGIGYDESAPLAEGHAGYGPLKARSEEAIEAALPGRVAIVRPGLIVGPHDPTGRFTYWPMRVARGGEVLAPGRPARPVQWIDVRDLAAWCLHLAATRTPGVFSAVGPTTTMAALLDTCREVAGSDARIHWIDDDTLLAARFTPWTELPLWLPESDPTHGGMLLADARRATSVGLGSRLVEATVRDVLAWARAEVQPASAATLDADKEATWLAEHGPA